MVRPPIHRRRRTSRTSAPTDENVDPTPLDHPVFAQPQPTADPTQFRLRHPSDADAYKTIDELNAEHKLGPMPFPAPRGGTGPILTLAQVLGPSGDEAVKRIAASGQLVFHAVGDTGSTRGPHNQSLVADKMIADFDEEAAENVPQFFFHLGDVIYNFGEVQYYYDQFYEPYRDYPAPIFALAGNHDGMVAPGTNVSTLAFLDNFCATDFVVTPEAGGLSRTAQIQPGVFFTFEAPLLRIIALYSNVLEDPGVIASPEIGNVATGFPEGRAEPGKEIFGGFDYSAPPSCLYGWFQAWLERGDAGTNRSNLRRDRRLAACRAFGTCAQLPALHPRPSGDANSLRPSRQRRPQCSPPQARARRWRPPDGGGGRLENERHLALRNPVPSPDRAPNGERGE